MATFLSALCYACTVGACGADVVATGDADIGVPGDASMGDGWTATEISPPAEAQPPNPGPCSSGWRTVTHEEGVMVCEPWPASGREVCTGSDQAHFAGGDGCVRVGTECPSGEYPEGLPVGSPVLYVSSSAAGGGTGTIDQPLATIRDAALRALPGSIIAVGKGTFVGAASLGTGVTLVGACVGETIIEATTPSRSAGAIHAAGEGVVIRNLRIGPSARLGASVVGPDSSLTIEDTVIEGATVLSVLAFDASLTLRRVVIRDAAPGSDGSFGRGLELGGGARATLEDVVIERIPDDAIFVAGDGSTLDATGLAISDARRRGGSGDRGHGVSVREGAIAMLEDCVIERTREVGIAAYGAGTRITLERCVVRDTLSRDADGMIGRGLDVDDGAVMIARAVVLERNREAQAMVSRGASLTIEDAVIREALPQEGAPEGGANGLLVQDGATADVTRTSISGSIEFGVSTRGASTVLTARDLVVIGTRASTAPEPFGGFGLTAVDGAAIEITRGRFEQNQVASIVSSGANSRMTLEDLIVRDTAARADGQWGRGLNVQSGGAASVTRALFEGNREYAVQGFGAGSVLSLADLVVRNTRPRDVDDAGGAAVVGQDGVDVTVTDASLEQYPSGGIIATGAGTTFTVTRVVIRDGVGEAPTGFYGRGITVQDGATLTGTDLRLLDQRDLGIFAGGAGTVLTIDGLEVGRVTGRRCGTTTCTDAPFGFGIGVYDDAIARVTRFSIHDASLCGVQLASNGQLDLTDGEVTRAAIGACVQVDGYDVDRLREGVDYVDNGTNLDSTSLPVPTGVPTLPGGG